MKFAINFLFCDKIKMNNFWNFLAFNIHIWYGSVNVWLETKLNLRTQPNAPFSILLK